MHAAYEPRPEVLLELVRELTAEGSEYIYLTRVDIDPSLRENGRKRRQLHNEPSMCSIHKESLDRVCQHGSVKCEKLLRQHVSERDHHSSKVPRHFEQHKQQ